MPGKVKKYTHEKHEQVVKNLQRLHSEISQLKLEQNFSSNHHILRIVAGLRKKVYELQDSLECIHEFEAPIVNLSDIAQTLVPYIPTKHADGSGVYVLVDGDEAFYVGKATIFSSRIKWHERHNPNKFDRILVRPSHVFNIEELEACYIDVLKPRGNTLAGYNLVETSLMSRMEKLERIREPISVDPKISAFIKAVRDEDVRQSDNS